MQTAAIMISKVSELNRATEPYKFQQYTTQNHFTKEMKKINQSVIEHLEGMEVDRLYFGNEFCEFLIPKTEDINRAVEFCSKVGYKFTLVTPFVTEYGIHVLDRVLSHIDSLNLDDFEVVFNDWGTLYMLKNKYPHFTCIAGRLMDKMIRDPRLNKYDYENCFTLDGLDFLKNSNLTARPYQELLSQYGVNRVEIDNVPQGFQFLNENLPMKLSVYVPFGYVTTGRICMMRSLPYEEDKKYVLENQHCHKLCLRYDQTMYKQVRAFYNPNDQDEEWEIELYRKGNTVFYTNLKFEEIKSAKYIDRLIYQPIIPM